MSFKFNDEFQRFNGQISLAHEIYSHPDQNFVLVSPTGSGKTEIGYLTIAEALNQKPGTQAIVTVPNRRVRDQWVQRAGKYGIDRQISVATNPAKDEIGVGWQRRGPYGRNDYASRKEKKMIRESRGQYGDQKTRALASDVVVTTSPLLKSDLERGREGVDELLRNTSTVIIDEVPEAVAFNEDGEDSVHRVSRYFDEMLQKLNPSAQIVGLTAFPGSKYQALERVLDAETIKPPQHVVDQTVPEIGTHITRIEDPLVSSLEDRISERTTQLSYNLVNNLNRDGKNYRISDLNMGRLSTLMSNQNDPSTAALAGAILNAQHTGRRLLEMPLSSFQTRGEDGEYVYLEDVSKHANVETEQLRERLIDRNNKGKDLGKPEFLLETVRRIPGQSVIAFNYPDSASSFRENLQETASTSLLIGGNKDQHETHIEDFKEGESRFMVMTHDVGGYGLDFPNADNVFFGGMPATEERRVQTRGRITRFEDPSQPRPVTENIPVYASTFEENHPALELTPYEEWPGKIIDPHPGLQPISLA